MTGHRPEIVKLGKDNYFWKCSCGSSATKGQKSEALAMKTWTPHTRSKKGAA